MFSFAFFVIFFISFARCYAFDSEFKAKFLFMCVCTLISWSFGVSLSIRMLGIKKTLPVIVLALLLLAMDYINFYSSSSWENDGPSGGRMISLFCTYYHAVSISLFFLTINLFSYSCQSRFLSFFRTFLFSIFFVFSLSVIGNRLLSGSGLNGDSMVAILQTNREEAYHYFFGLNNGLLLLFWLFLVILTLCVFIRFAFAPLKDRIKRLRLLSKAAACCCVIVLLPCVAMGIKASMYHFFAPRMYKVMIYPTYYSRDLKMFHKNREDYVKKIQERLSSINTNDCFSGKYVVVVGESLNRNFMGCYGYHKNTTPFQTSLKKNDNFVLFKNCFACHVQTPRVLLLLLTSLNQYNEKGYEISDATSIIDIANLYQYQTEWASGQEKIAIANSAISALAESANRSYYSTEKTPYRDLDVVQHLNKDNILGEERSLTFVHLNGNHYPYHLSFPADLAFEEQGFSLYEKSVVLNDTILSKLYDLVQSNNVDVMVYVSDHADAVSVQKGHDPRDYLQEMAEIPLWIYFSDSYRKKHPEIVERLRGASEQVITHDLVFDLLLYIMGMDNEFVDTTLVPGSDNYRVNEKNARTLYGQKPIYINGTQSTP